MDSSWQEEKKQTATVEEPGLLSSLDAAQRNLGGEENLSQISLRSIWATEL